MAGALAALAGCWLKDIRTQAEMDTSTCSMPGSRLQAPSTKDPEMEECSGYGLTGFILSFASLALTHLPFLNKSPMAKPN